MREVGVCDRCREAFCLSCDPDSLTPCEGGGVECEECQATCAPCGRDRAADAAGETALSINREG